MENLKIIAKCENEIPTNQKLFDELGDLRTIVLAQSFLKLNERDQLMVVKACLKTHYDLFNGSVPAFGKILFYVLCISDSENRISCFTFDTHGKFVSNSDSGIN